MKILLLGFMVGVIVLAIIATILFYENLALQQTINLSNDNLANTYSILDEYEKQFGNITLGYEPPPVSLDGGIYVIEGIGGVNTNVEPNSSYTLKTNHDYLIQAHLTRKDNIKPSLIYYVCNLQILNSSNQLVVLGWGDMVLIPKHDSSNCALQWVPTKAGNYTAQLYAGEDELGTSPLLAYVPKVYLHVLP